MTAEGNGESRRNWVVVPKESDRMEIQINQRKTFSQTEMENAEGKAELMGVEHQLMRNERRNLLME